MSIKFKSYKDGIATFIIDDKIVNFGGYYVDDVDIDGKCSSYPKFWKFSEETNKYELDDWWIICPDAPIFIVDKIKECLNLFNSNIS